jgi:hypothetical protein
MWTNSDQYTGAMIEVFKTNVAEHHQAVMLEGALLQCFPASRINFDLEDCDKILRVQGNDIVPVRVIEVLNSNGYQCGVLE